MRASSRCVEGKRGAALAVMVSRSAAVEGRGIESTTAERWQLRSSCRTTSCTSPSGDASLPSSPKAWKWGRAFTGCRRSLPKSSTRAGISCASSPRPPTRHSLRELFLRVQGTGGGVACELFRSDAQSKAVARSMLVSAAARRWKVPTGAISRSPVVASRTRPRSRRPLAASWSPMPRSCPCRKRVKLKDPKGFPFHISINFRMTILFVALRCWRQKVLP